MILLNIRMNQIMHEIPLNTKVIENHERLLSCNCNIFFFENIFCPRAIIQSWLITYNRRALKDWSQNGQSKSLSPVVATVMATVVCVSSWRARVASVLKILSQYLEFKISITFISIRLICMNEKQDTMPFFSNQLGFKT